MTRPVFDWVESASTQLTEEPRVRQSDFGDGYSQRQADGLNSNAAAWDMRFTGIDDSAADAIVTFFRARNGVEAFEYTPLWETTAKLFIAKTWTRTRLETPGFSDVTATFKQVFEP